VTEVREFLLFGLNKNIKKEYEKIIIYYTYSQCFSFLLQNQGKERKGR
jgi:hypothetical protein